MPSRSEARRVGIDVVEASDDDVTLDRAGRRRGRRLACGRRLAVFGETGSKHDANGPGLPTSRADDAFEAGAERVIVEAAVMVANVVPERGMIDALRHGIDPARTSFELPGPRISGVNTAAARDPKNILGEALGPDAGLGDVMVDDLFGTETSPRGFGVVQPTRLARQAPPPRHEDRSP